MLKGSEEKLATDIAAALTKNISDPLERERATLEVRKMWVEISKILLNHIALNAGVMGTCPPNGGPLTLGTIQ